MSFIADLHIHSRFSMATSKQLNIAHLGAWAGRKGINVLGTGDFTHPKWRAELARDLVYDEGSGLYGVSPEIQKELGGKAPLFCLQAEISSIYKRDGKTRKVHNLVFAPHLEAAEAIARRLALIGNIASDGRPILGLDSHDLLEIILECAPGAVLIPAHIWTPWFSLFGSKSGFDRIEDCYGDLTQYIFALETGLSSDPAMNRCLSALDNYALVSNSDAHSGANLGREANLFSGAPSYAGMFDALRNAARRIIPQDASCQFMGTLEFYPEEGKYHLDGHRACNIALTPAESRELNNICPVCGKPLTIGVLHRVMELADRETPASPPHEPEARMLVPLPETLAQILGAGVSSRKVQEKYQDALERLGPELQILCHMPISEIAAWWEPLGEAVRRIRQGNVDLRPGYDGQYGVIGIFSEQELADIRPGKSRIMTVKKNPASLGKNAPRHLTLFASQEEKAKQPALEYTREQQKAIKASGRPVFVEAGPGAGKTRVLIERIKHLVETGAAPADILALTFTRRAAQEMRQRLAQAFPGCANPPFCDTMHALAWDLLKKTSGRKYAILSEDAAKRLFKKANHLDNELAWEKLNYLREKNEPLPDDLAVFQEKYLAAKSSAPDLVWLDYTDLLVWLLDNSPRFQHVLVDEAQDLSPLQAEIIRRLAPEGGNGFFGIGDPDQSIYEFRGASPDITSLLRSFWPNLAILPLSRSFRSAQNILDMAGTLLGNNHMAASKTHKAKLHIFHAKTEKAELRWITEKILGMLGPTAHTLQDARAGTLYAPGDIAVLARLNKQLEPLAAMLEKYGIPYSLPAKSQFWHDELCGRFLEQAREANASLSPAAFAEELALKDNSFSQLPDAFAELDRFWRKCGSWGSFWNELAWLNEAELVNARAQNVRLMSLHAAKGLEFEAVFIPGLETGLLPLDRSLLFPQASLKTADMEAEKRLFYVGLTRAASAIYLSYSDKRRLYGRAVTLAPSPFLGQISQFCSQSSLQAHTKLSEVRLPLFADKTS